MPHAETHTVILPHAVAYIAPFSALAASQVARAFNLPESQSAAQGLFDLAKNNGAPYSSKQLGFREDDLENAAESAAKAP